MDDSKTAGSGLNETIVVETSGSALGGSWYIARRRHSDRYVTVGVIHERSGPSWSDGFYWHLSDMKADTGQGRSHSLEAAIAAVRAALLHANIGE